MSLRPLLTLVLVVTAAGCASRTTPATEPSAPESAGTATLTVRPLGLESTEGQVAFAVYDSEESFETREAAVASGRVEAGGDELSWSVEALQPGSYAVAVYHDLNGNGRLDRNAVGIPTEPYGFSNDARGSFGPPKFGKAAIDLGPGETTIEISLR
jgi:uncharacterized protein (DUF2141 family)